MRLHTSLGDLNLELHADLAPKTCENFFALLEGGYYTGTAFHRSIKNFMIQVGSWKAGQRSRLSVLWLGMVVLQGTGRDVRVETLAVLQDTRLYPA